MNKNKKSGAAKQNAATDETVVNNTTTTTSAPGTNGTELKEATDDGATKQPTTVKASELKGTPEMKGTVLKVIGTKMLVSVIHDEKEYKFGLPIPQSKQRSILCTIPGISGEVIVHIDKIQDKPGRPVDPNSPRQIELAAKEARRKELEAQGIIMKRGRPASPGSNRQETLAERDDKLNAIKAENRERIAAQLKTEHPDWDDEAIAKHPLMGEIHIDSISVLPKGRPVQEGSKRQETLAERAERIAANGGVVKLGRPSEKDADIAVAQVMEFTPEEIEELGLADA